MRYIKWILLALCVALVVWPLLFGKRNDTE